ncbi:hypothetical protein Bca52824_029180 [Brassica carinata]|uniref:1-phosphatidylinositol 4-kinase n=1 Tax=Brassica carinata TaxID=52824 RepID=A0A8X8ASL6_BRACI|nr:hypothetical protein Bca52824_029180 [Brassica carinata]
MKHSIPVGETGVRELATYFLDYQGFTDIDTNSFGPGSFTVSSVHRIGILDVRVLNLDRHAGNMLVMKRCEQDKGVGIAELVPIDHGLCLPECLDDPYLI